MCVYYKYTCMLYIHTIRTHEEFRSDAMHGVHRKQNHFCGKFTIVNVEIRWSIWTITLHIYDLRISS